MTTLDVLRDRLVAAGVARAYKLGEVPASAAYPYAVIAGSAIAPDLRTLDGSGNAPYRFTVQCFGRTADHVNDLADKALAAFDAVVLADLPGSPQSRADVTTAPYRDPDNNGVLNVSHAYRF